MHYDQLVVVTNAHGHFTMHVCDPDYSTRREEWSKIYLKRYITCKICGQEWCYLKINLDGIKKSVDIDPDAIKKGILWRTL